MLWKLQVCEWDYFLSIVLSSFRKKLSHYISGFLQTVWRAVVQTQTPTQTTPGADGGRGGERSGKHLLSEYTAPNVSESAH